MEKELQLIKDFVEGNLGIEELEKQLYENDNFSKILRDKSIPWASTYIKTNPYDYLLTLNLRNASGRLNAQGTLKLFLDKKGINVNEFKKYSEDFNLILESQPRYIDADADFIYRVILPANKSKPKGEMKKIIKDNFKQLFKYHKQPPKWIQQPNWPIKNDKPLYFLGQLELKECELFHGNGCVYIFFNKDTGEIEVIKQFY